MKNNLPCGEKTTVFFGYYKRMLYFCVVERCELGRIMEYNI